MIDLSCELFSAARLGDARILGSLLEVGCDPNVRSIGGLTPMFVAQGEFVVDLLVRFGGQVNARSDRGLTPLHLLAEPMAVRAVAGAGADLEAVDCRGMTPLLRQWHQAQLLRRAQGDLETLDVCRALIAAGAKVPQIMQADPQVRDLVCRVDAIESARLLQLHTDRKPTAKAQVPRARF